MTTTIPPDDAIDSFVEAARRYCAFVEGAEGYPLARRLHLASTLLADLYARACRLPAAESTLPPTPAVQRPSPWPGFGPHDSYWKLRNPRDHDEPLAGSLTDDLLDTYQSVRAGLVLFEQGHPEARAQALCAWRLGLEHTWGTRVLDALRVLHPLAPQGASTH